MRSFFRFNNSGKSLTIFLSLAVILIQFVASAQSDTINNLQIGVRSSPPFIMIDEDSFSGISIELWESLAQEMGIGFRYKQYNDLGDLLRAIENNEVDLSVNPLTVTSERLTRFSFTQPYFISGIAIAVRSEKHNHVWLVLRNLISTGFLTVVFFLFLIIFVFGLMIWLFERRKNPEQFEKGLRGLGHGLWWSAVTMTTVGYGDKSPVTISGRIISVIWMFTAVIIISSFTASISASLTHNQITKHVSGLNDLHNVAVGTVKNSSTSEFLSESGIKHRKYKTLGQALDDLEAERLTAVVYDEPLLSYLIHSRTLENQMELIPSGANPIYFGFASKSLPLIEIINPKLIGAIEGKDWRNMLEMYNLRNQNLKIPNN